MKLRNGNVALNGRPDCSSPRVSSAGTFWLMSCIPTNLDPCDPTYAVSRVRLFVNACWMFTFQLKTSGVRRFWTTPRTLHGLAPQLMVPVGKTVAGPEL